MHATTPEALACPLSEYFLEDLLSTGDFDSLELAIADGMRRIACRAMGRCLESFDGMLADSMPYGWSVHERVSRTVITLVGPVTFKGTIFLDRFGRRRAWADEPVAYVEADGLAAGHTMVSFSQLKARGSLRPSLPPIRWRSLGSIPKNLTHTDETCTVRKGACQCIMAAADMAFERASL